MTEEELLAEEYICNGKCQDDITRNYVHCKTCTRLKDFLAGYKAGKAELEKENTDLKEKVNILDNCDRLGDVITEEYKDQLTKAKELLKRYVPYRQITDSKAYKDLADETEQFLEEIEK